MPHSEHNLVFFSRKTKILPNEKDNVIQRELMNEIIHFKKKNISFQLKDKYKSIIPMNIFTCWHTKDLPTCMKKNMDNLKEMNSEFKLYVYDEIKCRKFIKKYFDETVLNAYDKLKPCSYKSDLWRYCVLYIRGGVYIDIKYKCINNFKFIALTEKEYFVKDREEYGSYTGLIVSLPKNQVLWKCVQKIVDHVRDNHYGSNALDPTGPGLLGSFFSKAEIQNMELQFEHTNIENYYENLYYIIYNGKIILTYYKKYREEQQQFQKFEHYSVLWEKKDIYV
jgi:mannosyltransferase OCH1-like enzyme